MLTLSLLLACTEAASTDTAGGNTDTSAAGDTATDTGDTDTADTDTADTGSDTAETGDTEDTGPSYSRDVFPNYANTCGDCHHDWGGPDDAAKVYDKLLEGEMGKPFIVPNDREASWLYDKIAHDAPADHKQRMPPTTAMLDDVTLAALATWIDNGAADDSDWGSLFPHIWMERHCHNCHEEWGQTPEAVLASLLSGTVGSVPLVDAGDHTNSYVYLKTAWNPPPDYGEQMPKTFPYLDADTIEKIGLWIDAGAPNN